MRRSNRDRRRLLALVTIALSLLSACSNRPLVPYGETSTPLLLVPLSKVGVEDDRAYFRHLLCEVNRQVGAQLPDHRSCDDLLVRVGTEPSGVFPPLARGRSDWGLQIVFVPGLGWDCLQNYVDESSMLAHVEELGYRVSIAALEGLSSSARNAELLNSHLMAIGASAANAVVLVGYSKGVPDILELLQLYPQWRSAVRAVVSIAGAVGGSPLADHTSINALRAFQWVPGAECPDGDGGALDSLSSETRRQWLVDHPLPAGINYYSLVTYPQPANISRGLRSHYKKLSRVDARNDSQLIFYDQILPAGKLLGFVNADHLAIAVPVARTHRFIGSTVLNHNAFPREVMMEAVLRYLERELPGQ